MKKDGIDHIKDYKLNRKLIVLISIVISMSLIISTYMYNEGSIGQSGAQANPIIFHIHPILSLMMDNKSMAVPSDIGIDSTLWSDHSLDKYGMQAMPEMGMSGMASLHTHDDSGTIHVESSINRNYTLGEFFKTWGLDLENKIVKATANEKPITDFKNIALKDGEKILLDIKSK